MSFGSRKRQEGGHQLTAFLDETDCKFTGFCQSLGLIDPQGRYQLPGEIFGSEPDIFDRYIPPVASHHGPVNHETYSQFFKVQLVCFENFVTVEKISSLFSGKQCHELSGGDFMKIKQRDPCCLPGAHWEGVKFFQGPQRDAEHVV